MTPLRETQLNLRFLGNPEVFEGEQRLKLVALFWPESEAKLGFAALRNTLARLRATLSQVGPLLPDQEGTLGFDFNISYTLDLHPVREAEGVMKAGQPDVISLQAAVTAYRADFLEGFSLADAPAFDDWVSFQREHWHHQMDLIFEALSSLQAERRDVEAGITATLRWLAHHPLNEAAHRRLMQLYFLKGDRSAALQVFAQCQAVLQAELGLEPSAETKVLAERIKKDEGGRRKDENKSLPSFFIPRPLSFQDLPFAGRAAEHAQLAACYQTVRQGQPCVVVIQGEAGIGKTRLATEFLNWLVVQAADVLYGRAFEAGGRLPYQPVVEALRQRLEQENAPDDLLSDVWLAELSRLLPELADRYPDLPPPVADEGLARTRLPEAVARLAIYSQQMTKAKLLLDEAKQIAETSGDEADLAQTEWSLGQLTHHSDDFAASQRHSERALALARKLDDPTLIAGASNTLAYALFFLGQLEAAAKRMEAARAGYAALGNRDLETDSLVGLAATRFLNGEIEASIAAARSALAIGQEIENAFGQAMSQPWLICGLLDRGDYGEALAIARRNLAATRSQELAPKMLAAFSAGIVYWALGDAEAAGAVHQELNPFLIEANVTGYLEQNAAHLCVDAALAGDWQTAHTYARQALSLRNYQALPLFLTLHWPETEALLRGGDIELAREDTRRWGEMVGHLPRYRPLYLCSLALLAQWEGNTAQAIAYLEEAYTLAEAIGLWSEQWQLLAKLGALYQRQGDEDKAQPALRQAREIIQTLAVSIDDKALQVGFLAAAHLGSD